MAEIESANEALATVQTNLANVGGSTTQGVPEATTPMALSMQGDLLGPKDSILPREFRQMLYKQFARIEREFEREYRRLYSENLALQERLEKFEDGDHSESTTLAKKLGTSMLSQRIKQQYKQSTSRLVSTLRQSSGHTVTTGPMPTAFSVYTGSFAGHGGSWQLVNQLAAHKDGVWEVTPHGKLLATASADTTVRLWANDAQLSCLLVYLGHSGSVNSVRFRSTDHLLLTSSGDGSAHLLRLPYDLLVKATNASAAGQSTGTAAAALEAASSSLTTLVGSGAAMKPTDSTDVVNSSSQAMIDEDSPMRAGTSSTVTTPIAVRHPHATFQSVNLGSTPSMLSPMCNAPLDSSPLSAADFLTGRDQLVTAGWDRLGRIYDLNTGQEVNLLTGHDHQLTDVRCASDAAPLVVTSSMDGTFRLWDFRQPGMRIHVQQAHAQSVSTTQFLPGNPTKHLISAGSDHLCRIWDLRQTRGPLISIRTDSGINRIAISGSLANTAGGGELLADPVHPIALGGTEDGNDVPGKLQQSSSSAPASQNWSTSYSHVVALPLNNRGIKFYDLNGNRLGRLARSTSRGHSRIVTSVAWSDEGVCNFFSTGFDCRLLAWQIQFASS